VDADMVRLNMAILAIDCGDFASALTYLDQIEKSDLRWGVEGSRVLALEGVSWFAEAAELGEQILEERPEGDEEYDKRVGFVAAAVARIRLRQGSSTDEVRSFLLHCLDEYGCSVPVLREIRGLEELRYSNDAKYFRFIIHASLPVGHPWYPKAQEYGIVYDVVSDSESGAFEMINQFESASGVESLEVLRVEIKEDKPDEPMGVYWVTERVPLTHLRVSLLWFDLREQRLPAPGISQTPHQPLQETAVREDNRHQLAVIGAPCLEIS
jgi:hypothetical protein